MRLPPELLDLANRQHNVLARRQALDWITGPEYDGFLRHGRLVRLHHGVAAIAGGASPPQQRLMAAALRCGDGARISGPAVLGLFDVDGFTPRDDFVVLVPAGRRIRNVDVQIVADPLPAEDVAIFDEIPIARPPLAFLHAAERLRGDDDRRLRVGIDSARRGRHMTRRALAHRARQLGPAHPGAAWVLDLEHGGRLAMDSEREREVADVLACVHPAPTPQVYVADDIRVDFCWPRLRVVLEYDGWVDHPLGSVRDRRRRERLAALGYQVIVVRSDDLRDPDALAARVQLALVTRARELGVRLG